MSQPRGRTRQGRARARGRQALQVWARGEQARPLLHTEDHGRAVSLRGADVEAVNEDRWIEPFLTANHPQLTRLRIDTEARATSEGVRLLLWPRERIGAVPLLSPTTRRVICGLLVRPRFGWPSMGRVLGGVGYRVEPDLGGAPLVPGSAREVPPWILAGPVLARITALMGHLTRGFAETTALRDRPRGRVDWNGYARRSLPAGRWQQFPCTYSDLREDEWFLQVLRWTVQRLATELEPTNDSAVGRRLLEEARLLLQQLGPGAERRPGASELAQHTDGVLGGEHLLAGLEAVGWVRDERGLGGARTLDGLTWTLATDSLWEAWVESLLSDIARRTGAHLTSDRRGDTRHPLVWHSQVRSLGHLAPDLGLAWPGRRLWVDAKYKAHLLDIAHGGWAGVTEAVRDAHRADVHQALAYATLSDAPRVDTWLVYPLASAQPGGDAASVDEVMITRAEVTGSARRVDLALVGLPFGFASAASRERALAALAALARAD